MSAELKKCYICGVWGYTERHHVFNGAFRKKSEKYGYVVNLCHWCHNEPPDGVHHNAELDNWLKAKFQKKAMQEQGWTTEEFIAEFGRNYIDDE